jgi:hypothetical protein
LSAIWSLVKKQHSHDERIAIMIDKAAGRLDVSACKKNQIIASESIPIADLQASEDNDQGIGAAVNTFCQQHQLSSPTCTLMLPASSYQMLLVEAPPVSADELAEALQWKVKDLLNTAMEESVIDGFLLPDDAYRGRQKMAYTVVANRAQLDSDSDGVLENYYTLRSSGQCGPPGDRAFRVVEVQARG